MGGSRAGGWKRETGRISVMSVGQVPVVTLWDSTPHRS
jgi:hypothetical protein